MTQIVDVSISSAPAKIETNFEAVKKALSEHLQQFDVLVTEDTLADCKKLATELNKMAGTINERRKEEVKRVSAPIQAFEEQMKELSGMCQDGRQKLLKQIEHYEDRVRVQARELLEAHTQKQWDNLGVEAEFRSAEWEDLVNLSAVTKAGNLANKASKEVEARVQADKNLQDRTRMRLLELENVSWRNGLSSPLTRDHVAGFLFADDATYSAELQRIIDAETRREEQARQRMRQNMEREQQEREAAQPAQNTPADCAPAAETPQEPEAPAEEPEEEAPAFPAPAESTMAVTVRASFTVNVPPQTSDEDITNALRRQMERAGFTTLTGISVERDQEAA